MVNKHSFNPNAFIIRPDDTITPNEQSSPPHLDLLQETVGGPIAVLYVPLTVLTAAGLLSHQSHNPKIAQLIVNEEGQIAGRTPLPSNPIASSIVGSHIVGTAILLIDGAKME